MKLNVLVLALIALLSESAERPAIPAFPGAEGFGSSTPGGRGGRILFVDNLGDSGPGSLRAACEARGPRFVLFRVAGIVDLQSPVRIREPFITVAGQSAPGDGICLRRYGLLIDTHDVVIRFLRSRPGDLSGQEVDAMSIGGASRNVVVDHCSASWSVDEALSPSGAISDVTVQWCLIAESLDRSVHSKGPHGYGSLVRASGGVSLHHNLWAHHRGRNPRLGDNYGRPPWPVFDVRNNVVYNPGGASIAGDRLDVNYVANLTRPGPDSDMSHGIFSPTETSTLRYFLDGNLVEGHPGLSAEPLRLFARLALSGSQQVEQVREAFPSPPVRTSEVSGLLGVILPRAGATRPARDAVDRRIVADVEGRKGSIIHSQNQVGGWPDYRAGTLLPDTDGDGIPDAWEEAHGLNPRSAADAVLDRNGDGYTNLEEYLDDNGSGRGGAGSRLFVPGGAVGRSVSDDVA